MTVIIKNVREQLIVHLKEREQSKRLVHYDRLELNELLFEEFGLIPESGGNEEIPFEWAWLGEWASYFSAKEAFEWIKAGIFDPEDAYQMKRDGQSPEDKVQED